ncbi:MAG: SUF system NifU family Fe-S cluster assembly protein [Deltaproteobacteria bacterium]|nr:SUF system NifU family Fe-S cluster assembly protein [Deltaproteobacteria bacterium]
MSDDLYQALIVLHDRAPRHHGPLAGATHVATIDNPLCGDEITVRVILDGDRVQTIAFEGHGCALSRAAASMMSERAVGATTAELTALAARFAQFVQAPPDATEAPDAASDAALGDLVAFRGVRRARSRRTCATLPFRALLAALAR